MFKVHWNDPMLLLTELSIVVLESQWKSESKKYTETKMSLNATNLIKSNVLLSVTLNYHN